MKKNEDFTRAVQKVQMHLPQSWLVSFFSLLMLNLSSFALAQQKNLTLEQTYLNAGAFPGVEAGVVVRDHNNLLVGGLTETHFSVYEDGVLQQPITVEAISSDSGGVSVVLIMDISGSMRQELPDAKQAAKTLVDHLNPYDRGALISFDENPKIEQNFTSDFSRLKSAIESLRNGSGTAVYDATLTGIHLLENQPGQKAIVLLTDGRDGDSDADLDEVTKALRDAKIPVYAVGLGVNSSRGEEELHQIARAGGGIFYNAPSPAELEAIYLNIAWVISKHMYRIRYASSNCATDGSLRQVEIVVHRDGFAAADTGRYTAPETVSKLALQTDSAPTPTMPFTLQIITSSDSNFAQNLSEIGFRVRYNSQYLRAQPPLHQHIRAGAVFGADVAHTISAQIDSANGVMILHIRRVQPADTSWHDNILAEIDFVARENLPDSTSLFFAVDSIWARSKNDCAMNILAEPATVLSDGMVVWPGDTDANGRVELADILVLGRFWKMTGPARPGSPDPLLWQPQVAKKFSIRHATHADADGQGQISEQDLIPIGLNWGKSTQDRKDVRPKIAAESPSGSVYLSVQRDAASKNFLATIWLDRSNRAELAGMVIKLELPRNRGQIQRVEVGEIWQNQPLFFSRIEPDGRQLSAAIMLTPAMNKITVGGEMLRIKIATDTELTATDLQFESVGLVATDGSITQAAFAPGDAKTALSLPDVVSIEPAYPNPFNPVTSLRYRVLQPVDLTVQIFRITGELVKAVYMPNRLPGEHVLQWHGIDNAGRAVGSGTYFARWQAFDRQGRSFQHTQKLMLIK